jgi:pimeloyl-ACP methyl ester carboxylesterase
MPTVQVNGAGLYYSETGRRDGEVVVFSHGLLFDHTMFEHQIATLSDAGYRVIGFDWRGQGRSLAAGGEEAYAFESLAEDAYGLLQYLEIARCHWVGLSMGGMVGFHLYFKQPELFRSLTLIDTSADPEEAESLPRYRQMAQAFKAFGPVPALMEALQQVFFAPSFKQRNPKAFERWSNLIASNQRESMELICSGVLNRPSVTERLGEIKVPTLIMVGDHDAATVPAHSETMHGKIAGSKLVIIPDAGHSSTVEQPEFVSRELLGFLKSLKNHG